MFMLLKLAQTLAKNEFEQEGISSWDEIDKYEKEDRVYTMYNKICKDTDNLRTNNLKMIKGEWHMRDPKTGRFCKVTNETTNTNLNNVKENDIMMNKKANERIETLKANGIDTSNFFDISMRLPMGAEIKILVNDREVIVPTASTSDINNIGVGSNKINLINAMTGDVVAMVNDPIAQSIINNGYVKNNKLFRRWIFAQTISLLNYVDPKNSNRKGWEAGFKDLYDYNYTFKMLLEEMHVLAILQREDPEQLAERTHFFNGDVVVATLNDYLHRLKKYVNKQIKEKPRKYRGEQYVKLSRYGNVLIKDLNVKVYNLIQYYIDDVALYAKQDNYKGIEDTLKIFMKKYYNKLPYNTPKCAVFKDAFKGAGSFYSLQNAIRFHNVVLPGYNNKYDSENILYELLNGDYKGNVWKFHKLLVDSLKYNHFDLKQSIADGNSAKNTTSTRADVYKR